MVRHRFEPTRVLAASRLSLDLTIGHPPEKSA
jgi:hypothetical protein